MKSVGIHRVGGVVALLALLTPLTATGSGAAEQAAPRALIVELFTSQGCSSCPPADRLLAGLAGQRRAAGRQVEVVPLAFHVDYWDGIGWPDPFASPAWTERQRRYARWLGDNRIYTPQLVVAGGRHAVGSNRQQVEALIAWAASRPDAVALAGRAVLTGDRLTVHLEARAAGGLGGLQPAVMVAVYDGGHETAVARGENARRTLHNERVVRRLERAFVLRGEAAGSDWRTVLDPGWQRAELGVAVFAQDPGSGAILGAAAPRIVVQGDEEAAP